jgi:hypothetical protein
MAITYHAGRRLQGLERVGSTPTKEFNFSSSTGWVSGNTTYFYISSDKLNVKSDTDNIQTNMTYDLLANDSITVGTSWVMTFTLDIASPYAVNTNSGNQHRCYIGLASATTVGEPANIDEVAFTICPRSDINAHESFNNNNTTAQYVGTGVTVTSGTKYIKLIRDGNTSFKTYIYNNADYSDTPTITEASNNLSNITGTKYIKVSQYVEGYSGTLNFTIDDLKFYNGVTSVVAIAGDVKPTNVQVGSRFEETDTRKMYHYVVLTNGTTSENVGWYEAGTTTPQYPPTRGVWASGYTNTGSPSGDLVIMDYVTIATTGNAINFGNLTLGRATPAGVSSYTRGVIGGGITSSASAEYITITTTGNATSFGNLTVARSGVSSATNRSRGVWAGGYTGSNTDVIDYITIDTTGNATDFGNLVAAKRLSAGLNSATRGCFAGGYISGASNTIDYITIASTGNATDFGDLSRSNYNMGTVSSDTRGVWAGGNGNTNVMDYITIASTGNATDFGDMNVGISGCGGNSDLTRGVFAGGWITNAMEYITIATTGNGTDFGDLTVARDAPAGGLEG